MDLNRETSRAKVDVVDLPPMPEWIRPEKFFHSHLHTVFSLRDGMIPVAGLVEQAKERGQRVVAATDHGLLGAAYELYWRANKAGLLPMIGLEAYTSPYRDDLLRDRERLRNVKIFKDKKERERLRRALSRVYHLVLLAHNQTGYYNLLKIHNEAQANGFYRNARTTNERVMANAEGLVISTACFAGEVPQLVLRDSWAEARHLVGRFKEAFPGRFFIELMLIEWDKQVELNRRLIRLAKETRTPLIFSCDAHYLRKEDAELHPILLNIDSIRAGKSLDALAAEDNVWEFEARDLFVKDVTEIWASFYRTHRNEEFTEDIFRGCLENLEYIASLARPMRLEHTPRLPMRADAEEELWRRCRDGLEVRLADSRISVERRGDYEERLAFEMKIILMLQSADYMLLFSDVAQFCDEHGIARGPGRGSVGGSLVAWLAGITQVDSIRHGLLFERFLDLERLPKMRLGL